MNRKAHSLHYLLLISFIFISFGAFSQLSLPAMFSDNMVLQQKTNAPIWGKSSPNKSIKVVTTWNKKTYTAQSDANGIWKVFVKTPSAGGPYEINISSDNTTLQFKNILIGEVWLCSGQSNMEMPLDGWGKINDYEKEISNANFPKIRLFQAKRTASNQPLEDIETTSDGWQVCSPTTISNFSATAYFFGKNLNENLNVPIGLIHTSWGGTLAEAWTSEQSLKLMTEFIEPIESFKKTRGSSDKIENIHNKPNSLYNAMIAPIVPYAIKGAIWYQGESNANRAYQYRTLFPLMINDWRSKWGYDFPFYFVQLANFRQINEEPTESDWAELREAQFKTLHLENTGMAVTIDVGDAGDIHPKNKQDVGKRLALQAREKTYGKKIISSGPLYKTYKIEDGKIIIYFQPSNSNLKVKEGSTLKGFAIAGPDKVFHWADAVISGDQVVVSSPKVSFPIAVRYAWSDNPVCNLYNEANLPASPFRTDDWTRAVSQNK